MKGVCSTYPNPDLWFPEMPQGRSSRVAYGKMVDNVSLAISICNRCPVKTECLAEGMALDNIEHGIWGGMLASERIRLANLEVNNITRRDAVTFTEGIHRWQELSLG